MRKKAITAGVFALGMIVLGGIFVFLGISQSINRPYPHDEFGEALLTGLGALLIFAGMLASVKADEEYARSRRQQRCRERKVLKWKEEREARQKAKPLPGAISREFSITMK